MKTVDKYQFNEEMATIDDGGTYLGHTVQTVVAHHTILKRKFTLKLACQGSSNEKIVYNYLIKEGIIYPILSPSPQKVDPSEHLQMPQTSQKQKQFLRHIRQRRGEAALPPHPIEHLL
jgi:hypothetical protein